MSTPNLPLRCEIENDGTGLASSLEQVCATVISEGGAEDTGIVRFASTNGTHVDCAVENTEYAILGIRLKSAYLAATIKLIEANVQIQTGSHQIIWRLRYNPTVAGTFTYSDVSNCAIQIATGATANTVTGGTSIGGGFAESGGIQGGQAGSSGGGLNNAISLGSLIDGTPDTIVLTAQPVGSSTDVDVEGSITFRELI